MELVELTYCGAHDAVEVRIPDWPPRPVVEHGNSHGFPPAIAELLLEQPSNWQRTTPEVPLEERLAKAKTHDELDAIAAELDVAFPDKAKADEKKAALVAAVAAAESNDDDAGETGEEQ